MTTRHEHFNTFRTNILLTVPAKLCNYFKQLVTLSSFPQGPLLHGTGMFLSPAGDHFISWGKRIDGVCHTFPSFYNADAIPALLIHINV